MSMPAFSMVPIVRENSEGQRMYKYQDADAKMQKDLWTVVC